MNLSKLTSKLNESNTVRSAVERGLLTMSQVMRDAYLIEGYYFNSDIYCITMEILVSEPKIKRGVDIPEYAFDLILSEGLILLFVCDTHIKLKKLNEKDFITISSGNKIPFGLDKFDSNFTYGTPILVVEGNRDLMVARRYYPYCIAVESSTVSSAQALVLATLTDKLISALDNDKSGEEGHKKLVWDKRFDVRRFDFPKGYKDLGDIDKMYVVNRGEYDYYDSWIKMQVKLILSSW